MTTQCDRNQNTLSHIFVCGNDPTLPQLRMFLSTLRNPKKGDYQGPITLLSDELSDASKNWLRKHDVNFFIGDISSVISEQTAEKIAAFEAAKSPLPNTVWAIAVKIMVKTGVKFFGPLNAGIHFNDYAFQVKAKILYFFSRRLNPVKRHTDNVLKIWRRKHLSKFLFLQYMASDNSHQDTSYIGLFDSDMVFQHPVKKISAVCAKNRVNVALEEYESLSRAGHTSPVYWSNLIAWPYDFYEKLNFGGADHEVNIGFTMATAEVMQKVFSELRALLDEDCYSSLWIAHQQHFWHEQDFFRLLYCLKPSCFNIISTDIVYHACGHAGDLLVEEKQSDGCSYYIEKKSRRIYPVVVHFAGKKRNNFPAITSAYSMNNFRIDE